MTSLGRRAGVSLGLSAYFLLVYGGASALAARRAYVPSFCFAWERRVPFVPAMIVPYLSIDLFFVIAPLLITEARPLRAYATRVLAAITLAGLVFVLMPLRFSFDRPAVDGVLGTMLRQFWQLDRPLNQLPSLHIALALIVVDPFLRRTRGLLKAVIVTWFTLIALSPLLVFQHHAIDLVAGLALGLICLSFFPDEGPGESFERNGRVGGYYLAASLLVIGVCIVLGRASWPLWWPAAAMGAVAACYLFVGPKAYGKRDGRLHWTARLLFWPTLLGQHASLAWYARQARAYDAVTDRLWIGRRLSAKEAAAARAAGVGAVIDLTCEFSEPAALWALPYLHLPTLDLTAPTPVQIDRAIEFLRTHAASTIVYVHCKAGYSRTAVIAATYLMATQPGLSADDALALLRRARPALVVRPEARRAIERFAARGQS